MGESELNSVQLRGKEGYKAHRQIYLEVKVAPASNFLNVFALGKLLFYLY